ncbi:MAG: alpha-glucan family phosphorylase [Elusimicrobiaceae bacterium]|jgi:glycogen phosphorylase|nr:alpha-glucan family phosphorylase [Elusimicrobiaceae bacterium]MBT3954974.1 alpha-glucan family phosphorylase [Elusimicrobiaceae bacterium]MBT4008134.1 alpha-glucan family phosphorylase [Elusimicrobiaceae bacterium]MBT4402670.1 alpha-glucan family phosphorylase [Elusimicrobiaceae bacterium]MBT4440046.1 alpha-glucan family phosphorylase [Elusimicrobiaceae bacterium]
MRMHSFNVEPNLPENISFLKTLSENMWFAWNWKAISLFIEMDNKLWDQSKRNPKWMLSAISQKRLETLSKDEGFLKRLQEVKNIFDYYQTTKTWYSENKQTDDSFKVAYFSMEYGIGEGLPIYSGGLGMLSGDHIKSSSDLNIPLIGVGLFYQKGYVQQTLSRDGWQNEVYPVNDWAHMPVEPVKTKDGGQLKIDVPLGHENIKATVWKVPVGRTIIYLLDTNLQENPEHHRTITEQLYGGDRDNRIRQEIVLGIGGVRMLKALNIKPTVYHINEGHSAFLLFERIATFMEDENLSYEEAKEKVWTSSVFTTHTPVVAGNEYFDPALVKKYLENYVSHNLKISWDDFINIGKEEPHGTKGFCMTVVALKLSAHLNGVSALHGKVSRDLWKKVWDEKLTNPEIPIYSITNGIHCASWISHEHDDLYRKYLVQSQLYNYWDPTDLKLWDKINTIPDQELWDIHKIRKEKLIKITRDKLVEYNKRLGADATVINRVQKMFDPNVLTIGFARRFATYKRAILLFKDLDKLDKIVNNPKRPVQFIFSGKAHPADTKGKEFIKQIVALRKDKRFRDRIIFLEDYNMNLARYMVQGVDVWLNTPIRPLEASGTSGMKAGLNGVLMLSVLDGWWDEVGPCDFGWSIEGFEDYKREEERDMVESHAIYNLLEHEIAPTYYEQDNNGMPAKWLEKVKKSIKHISSFYNTDRMLKQYYDMFYLTAHNHFKLLEDNKKTKEIAAWRKKIKENWHNVSVQTTSKEDEKKINTGAKVPVTAKVNLGDLKPEEIKVQICLGTKTSGELLQEQCIEMKPSDHKEGVHTYEAEISLETSGRHFYSIRVIPFNKDVPHPFTPVFVAWEN